MATGAVVIAGLLLAGCGSTPLSVKALISRASVVCDRATLRTDRIPTPTTPAGGKRFLSRGAASLETELTTLRRLRPRASESQSYKTALAATSQIVDELQAAARTLAHGGDPIDTIKALQRRLAPLEVRADNAWNQLDIPACASH
jgi:hypothetical protein